MAPPSSMSRGAVGGMMKKKGQARPGGGKVGGGKVSGKTILSTRHRKIIRDSITGVSKFFV